MFVTAMPLLLPSPYEISNVREFYYSDISTDLVEMESWFNSYW
jgi:hypothetical protein